MNQLIRKAFDKTVSLFKSDSRVVAAYHSGSIGTDREDEFSDVDPVFAYDKKLFTLWVHDALGLCHFHLNQITRITTQIIEDK